MMRTDAKVINPFTAQPDPSRSGQLLAGLLAFTCVLILAKVIHFIGKIDGLMGYFAKIREPSSALP